MTHGPVEGRLRDRAIADARKLVTAFGYDMDTVEFALKNDRLYAIDFLNPAPDFDNCAEGQNRTGDARFFRPALYQLSYLGRRGENPTRIPWATVGSNHVPPLCKSGALTE